MSKLSTAFIFTYDRRGLRKLALLVTQGIQVDLVYLGIWMPRQIKQSLKLFDLNQMPARARLQHILSKPLAPNLEFYSSFIVRVKSSYWRRSIGFGISFLFAVCFASWWKFF